MRASRIKKLYVHDDQVGPFSRMVFDGKKVTIPSTLPLAPPQEFNSMKTSWKGGDGVIGHTRAIPEILFVPLYNKIRIDFEYVRNVILEFDALIKQWLQLKKLGKLCEDFEWDLYLTEINRLKKEILESKVLGAITKETLVLESWPKYIWRCILRKNDRIVLELLFDATDIEGGNFLVRAIAYNKMEYFILAVVATQILSQFPKLEGSLTWPILQWLKANPNP